VVVVGGGVRVKRLAARKPATNVGINPQTWLGKGEKTRKRKEKIHACLVIIPFETYRDSLALARTLIAYGFLRATPWKRDIASFDAWKIEGIEY
jgi:hypothetical protein